MITKNYAVNRNERYMLQQRISRIVAFGARKTQKWLLESLSIRKV